MPSLFADRFKSARLRAGFSLQELADRLPFKISRQALHRYEKGEVIPDSEMMNALSTALGVRTDYFFREQQVSLGAIEYRKLKRMPAREEAKIVELTRDYLSRYLELEEILGTQTAFENPLEDYPVVSTYEQVNAAAEKVRKVWALGCDPIYNVAELLEDKFIKVVLLEADMAFDGLQTWATAGGVLVPVIAYNEAKLQKSDRIRFTLLHELAHLLLQFDETLSHRQTETLCHQFAAAMLLPESTIRQELGSHRTRISIEELGNLKRQYGISMQAAIMRARACGIINEHYTSYLFFYFRQQKWNRDEPVEYIGEERSHRFEQLLHRALIEEQISMSKAAALSNQKLADFKAQNTVL